ncbi:hypothetical protein NSMS1_32550 [Nostoc sp. MS1]|nr:hypothetical protein NSMS1_32550 [Nostoc sp. MS1]
MEAEISGYPPKNVYCRTYMQNQLSFVVKLLIMSAFLSALIKYAAPLWPIPATDINALILVLSPSIIMAIALLWRFQAQKQN